MCDASQTSSRTTDPVRGRSATQRSDQSQAPGHRLRANATANHPGQGAQGSLCAVVAQAAGGTSCVLETRSSDTVSLSGQDRQRAAVQRHNTEGLQVGRGDRQHQEARHATHFATQFCDGTFGSGSRSDGDQQATGTQQLYDYDDLFALSQATLGIDTQPDRLAPRAASRSNVPPD